VAALTKAVAEAGFKPEKVWGEVIEDRGSQITFSALGQQAPLEEKTKWDPILPSDEDQSDSRPPDPRLLRPHGRRGRPSMLPSRA